MTILKREVRTWFQQQGECAPETARLAPGAWKPQEPSRPQHRQQRRASGMPTDPLDARKGKPTNRTFPDKTHTHTHTHGVREVTMWAHNMNAALTCSTAALAGCLRTSGIVGSQDWNRVAGVILSGSMKTMPHLDTVAGLASDRSIVSNTNDTRRGNGTNSPLARDNFFVSSNT